MNSQLSFIAFIVPAFALFLSLEYWIAKRKKMEHLFTYEGSFTNISVGIAERLLNLFITGSFYGLYYNIFEHYSLFQIPNHWWVWITLLLAADFIWYWYHRLGHEVNLFWGAHIVHHQSEEFNYTVSARITTLQALIRNLFWCILPFIGFHPVMVIGILVVHGTYSFFTHTQLVGKLGWLEHILITPSHHGVHHASNKKYLDKNYGDIFVFWDKLFGTFQIEEEKPTYGITHPLKSNSFLWQHFHYYAELWEACRRSGSLMASIRIILGKPDTVDPTIRKDLENQLLPAKAPFRSTFRFRVYLNIQAMACMILLFFFTLYYHQLTTADKFFAVTIVLITLINCGAMLEQQKWVYQAEITRIFSFLSYLSILCQSFIFFGCSIVVILIISTMDSLEEKYYRFVYDR